MPYELLIIVAAALAGSVVQVAVGIGFSIIAGPPIMLLLGTSTAIPLLLLLNTVISAVATDWKLLAEHRQLLGLTIAGCSVGILLGAVTYPLLSERAILAIAASLILFGIVSTFLSTRVTTNGVGVISGFSGLATVWAATPGPVMIYGLLAAGKSPGESRRLVQPLALYAYGVSLLLHGLSGWHFDQSTLILLATVIGGSLVGRTIGPRLGHAIIINTVRVISLIACIMLYYRAFFS